MSAERTEIVTYSSVGVLGNHADLWCAVCCVQGSEAGSQAGCGGHDKTCLDTTRQEGCCLQSDLDL